MTTQKSLVEDWITARAILAAQIAVLKAEEAQGCQIHAMPGTLARLKICVGELNALLKAHARLDHAA